MVLAGQVNGQAPHQTPQLNSERPHQIEAKTDQLNLLNELKSHGSQAEKFISARQLLLGLSEPHMMRESNEENEDCNDEDDDGDDETPSEPSNGGISSSSLANDGHNTNQEDTCDSGTAITAEQARNVSLEDTSPTSAGVTSAEDADIKGVLPVQLRLLVRRREAGALIGKRGANIKRLRDTFKSSLFSIPDTGNGPERVVCIASDVESIGPILEDITRLLLEKSPENDEQIELKLLIHSSHAGSIIGIGGQSIRKLRNDSKAAIKIYEMCCPLSSERVCAIKAKPATVVGTVKLVQSILSENPIKGTTKPYDALNFDLNLVDKYGGYMPNEQTSQFELLDERFVVDPLLQYHTRAAMMRDQLVYPAPASSKQHSSTKITKRYSVWRASESATQQEQQPATQQQESAGGSEPTGSLGQSSNSQKSDESSKAGSHSKPVVGSGIGQGSNSSGLSVCGLHRQARFHPYNFVHPNNYLSREHPRKLIQNQQQQHNHYQQLAAAGLSSNLLQHAHHAQHQHQQMHHFNFPLSPSNVRPRAFASSLQSEIFPHFAHPANQQHVRPSCVCGIIMPPGILTGPHQTGATLVDEIQPNTIHQTQLPINYQQQFVKGTSFNRRSKSPTHRKR